MLKNQVSSDVPCYALLHPTPHSISWYKKAMDDGMIPNSPTIFAPSIPIDPISTDFYLLTPPVSYGKIDNSVTNSLQFRHVIVYFLC